MTTYRRFDVATVGSPARFVITEVEPTDRHPMNWIDFKATRESAWAMARAQHAPVTVNLLDGSVMDLGVVFSPEHFERAVYGGYVSAGYAMSDGYYAPIKFDSWVETFRNDAERSDREPHDLLEPENVTLRGAWPLYRQAVRASIAEADNDPMHEECPHGLSMWLCADPINHYPADNDR